MKYQTKIYVFLCAAVIICGCVFSTGCKKQMQTESAEKPFTITASFYPLYIMLLNITDGVSGVELSLLAPADTGCLHDYQLTTKDMLNIENSDVFVVNGAGMETFLDKILETKNPAQIITASGSWPLIDGNPHIWVSPAGAAYQVRTIAAGLAAADPEHGEQYRDNGEAYAAKLENLGIYMHSVLDAYEGSPVITFHEAFPYFAAEFNLNIAGTIEREPGSEPTAQELTELTGTIRQAAANGTQVPALFAEPGYSSSAAEIIASETGLTVYELDPAVTGKLDKDAYISAMEENTKILQTALDGSRQDR